MQVERKLLNRGVLCAALAVLVLAGPTWAGQAGKSPVKVFILAGQSNMEGQGVISGTSKGALESLVKDPASAARYKHLVDKDGKWVVRDDVWMVYGKKGKLAVGGFAGKGSIGPELGFGWVVGDHFDNQVLLIKVAAGGTSLAGDWRPPSSGGKVGQWYTKMIDGVKEQLKDLKKDFPDYDGKGYEIAGFGWHQGWQDGCSADMVNQYEKNLANFIRDVRKDLGVPKMPFVIGGSGFGGWEQKIPRRLKIMEAQAAVAKYDEFKDNVSYVETRGFYRAEDVSPHRFRYHWNGNAETYYLIGEGMGKAIVQLLGGPKAPANPTGPEKMKSGESLEDAGCLTASAAAATPAQPARIASAPKRTTPATYYVSQSSGNDSWTGEALTPEGTRGPWKTLARASIDCVPGDRILLKCGDTWNEELHPKGSGTPKNPITIGSYGNGKKPMIDRQDYRKDLFGIHLADQAGYKIVGIEFNRCMTGIYGEYSDGSPTRRFIWIEDCYFHDSLLYQHYEDYPRRKIGLGICFFSDERHNRIVLADITIKNCVFRRLASGVWTNSPDNFNKNASFIYNFGNMTFEGCLFEEGYQWQLGIRGVDGGMVRNCVTHDIGRGFRSFNGVAGAMFFRCKNWVFEDSEWGFVDIGLGSGDGEAFDFEGNCDNMTMRNCLFHDTDGPGFLLCCYASDGNPNKGIRMENCVLNGKAKRPIGLPKCEIVNTTDWNEVTFDKCRFYLSKGEVLMRVMDPEKEKRSTFVGCLVKNLSDACSTENLAAKAKATASSQAPGGEASRAIDGKAATSWKATATNDQWLELDFPRPATINEFRITEGPSSSVIRYVIECWDEKTSRWVGCFNGRTIGPDFIAPIVSRTTRKVRLFVARTTSGNPCIAEFEVYNDTSGGLPGAAPGGQ